MSSSIYGRLALTNLRNNRKTYLPYLLTGALTVMMYYIIGALCRSESIPKDGPLNTCLGLGAGVMALFSVIFLFYTNSFLIKRRKKEIGVYNILGMGKRHIGKMLCLETLLTALASIGSGLALGIVFGKLMYLLLLKILHYDVGMSFAVSPAAMVQTLALFLAIFAMTLAYNLLQIRKARPVELLRGGNQGEKEPKTRWLLASFGLVMVGIGYYLAVITKEPLEALQTFFVAVICVIIGTYALFVAGSIALLKFLKKRKSFYYQPSHFTTVSGMIYRMKQNGVGLANICILSTMVLVVTSSTVSLYAGMEDVLHTRFPREISVRMAADAGKEQDLQEILQDVTAEYEVTPSREIAHHVGETAVLREGDVLEATPGPDADFSMAEISEAYMIPLEDYNQMEGSQETLEEGEVLVYDSRGSWEGDTLGIGGKTWKVRKEIGRPKAAESETSQTTQDVYLIFPDVQEITEVLTYVRENNTSGMDEEYLMSITQVEYVDSFDLSGSDETKAAVAEELTERLADSGIPGVECESRELSRESFYLLYGGIFFIGLYLGVMFLMATVLIIYYKQISEGYNDRERYQIMQKVGMDKREVRRSIRSQVLTVFFLPLLVAFVHIAVAFKVITKLLITFNMTNEPLYAACTVITGGVFAVFYVVVFAVTAREYYRIVN